MLLAYTFTNILTDFRDPLNVYSEIDKKIPLVKTTILFYLTGYPALLAMPVLLIEDKENFLRLMTAIGSIAFISCLIFLCCPTTTYRPQMIGSDFFSCLFVYLHAVDGPNNCFPSLHVSLSCFIGWFLHEKKYLQYWPLIIALLVTLSTVFTKQHAIIDIIGGLAITWGAIKLIQSTYLTKLLNHAYYP